jgi:two-component system cell cycle sensor histidine kinase PleC
LADRRRREKGGSEAGTDFRGRAGARGGSSASLRIAVLTAMLMMAIYAVFALQRVVLRPPQDVRVQQLAAAADLASARADAELSAVKAALTAAREASARSPMQPADLADLAMKASAGSAAAVAVVDGGVLAQSGAAAGADWVRAASLAAAPGRGVWIGAVGEWVFAAVQIPAASGSIELLASIRPARLMAPKAGTGIRALAAADGRLLSGQGP